MPPGLERAALYELTTILKFHNNDDVDIEHFPGGLELELPTNLGLSLNALLKVPTRILMRMSSKEILHIKDYIAFIKSHDWKSFGELHKVYVSSRTSKLKIKGNLAEIFEKNAQATWNKEAGTDVYIRFFRDECTLSVDTSGEDLYQRGYGKWVGEAPIRDNMAAALLQFSLQGVEDLNEWEVTDPMMGSGTFLFEAHFLSSIFKRPYAFQKWRLDEKLKKSIHEVLEKGLPQRGVPEVRGFDRDPKVVEMAQKNFEKLDIKPLDLKLADVIKDVISAKTERKRLVIANPPYGKRFKINDKNLFAKIMEGVATKFAPERFGIILPLGIDIQDDRYEQVRVLDFANNGIPLKFFLFLKKENPPFRGFSLVDIIKCR